MCTFAHGFYVCSKTKITKKDRFTQMEPVLMFFNSKKVLSDTNNILYHHYITTRDFSCLKNPSLL